MILYAKFYLKEEIVLPTYQDNPIVQKNRWLILIAVASFTFMSTLDGSIVNIALPVISKDLNIPMNQVEWVVSIYLMTACACLLVFGKLGDSIGKIKVFRLGMIILLFCKRPITRCIASLQSSSYTVFKQKIGEDFL